jgi:hypothetical protein
VLDLNMYGAHPLTLLACPGLGEATASALRSEIILILVQSAPTVT